MSDFVKLNVNGRTYVMNRLNPIQGLEFCLEVGELYAGGNLESALMSPKAKNVIHEALGQCLTPENQALSDEVVFNNQFIKYPEDMFKLAFKAVTELTKPFFPSGRDMPETESTQQTKGKS
jgi:hypothetical protein